MVSVSSCFQRLQPSNGSRLRILRYSGLFAWSLLCTHGLQWRAKARVLGELRAGMRRARGGCGQARGRSAAVPREQHGFCTNWSGVRRGEIGGCTKIRCAWRGDMRESACTFRTLFGHFPDIFRDTFRTLFGHFRDAFLALYWGSVAKSDFRDFTV